MSNLRDLVVSVDFDDIDIGGLTLIDRTLDQLERTINDVGIDIDQLIRDFNQMGVMGNTSAISLSSIFVQMEHNVSQINVEINQLITNLTQLGVVGNISLNVITTEINQLQRNLNGMLTDINQLVVALAALGGAGSISMNVLMNEIHDLRMRLNLLEIELAQVRNHNVQVAATASLMGDSMAIAGLKGVTMGVLITAALAGIIAMAAPLVVLVGGLVASLMAAGAAAVAFGTVAMGALGPVIMGAENLTAAQQAARDNLESFVDFWKGFVKQFETPIFEMFGTGLQLVQNILTGLAPTISIVANMFNQLLTDMNNTVVAGGLQNFFDWLETNGANALQDFLGIFGNTFSGIFKMFGAFTDVGNSFTDGLLSMTERFNEWAGNLASSNGFQKFVDYALENGPVLMAFLGDLFGTLGDIFVALAPLGSLVLAGLAGLFEFLNANLGPAFSQLGEWGAMIADVFMNQILPAILPLAAQWLPVLGQWFDNLKLLGGALVETFIAIFPTLQSIFQAVMPVAIALFQNLYGIVSALITNVIVPLLPKIGIILSEVWSVVKPILEPLKTLFNSIGDAVMFLINDVVSPLIPVISVVIGAMWKVVKPILEGIVTVFGNIIDAISSTIDAVKDLVSAFANFKMPSWIKDLGGKIGGAISKLTGGGVDGSHATGLARVPRDGYVAELHANEAVLTATQSDALRDAGILKSENGKPKLDMGNGGPTIATAPRGGGTFAPQVQINIDGTGANAEEIATMVNEKVNESLVAFYRQMNMIIS